MTVWHIVGIDPGLVHTGVVRLIIGEGRLTTSYALVEGPDATTTRRWVRDHPINRDRIFVEKYDPRYHYNTDTRMIKAEMDLKKEMKSAKFVRNIGIKQVVTTQVLGQMGLWDFQTTSHHQDLRSAARIAVLGMIKDEELNRVVADLIRDALDGKPWKIINLGGGVLNASDVGGD